MTDQGAGNSWATPYTDASSRRRAGMRATAKVFPCDIASRRVSSRTAIALESNRSSAPVSATTAGDGAARSACASMRLHAAASSCVSCAGITSIARSALLRAAGVRLVALLQRGDQPVDTLAVRDLRKLAAIGFDQPDAEHVQVIDLPPGALPGCLFETVVE